MSDVLEATMAAVREKLDGKSFDGSLQVIILGEGSFVIDESGVQTEQVPTDCTLSADIETFRGLLEGDLNPTSAFMSGKLRIDGDMSVAMSFGSFLGYGQLPMPLPTVIIPGYFARATDYRDLETALNERGIPTVTVPLRQRDWLPTLGGRSVVTIIRQIDTTVKKMLSRYQVGSVNLAGAAGASRHNL